MWLKLRKESNVFKAFYSNDNINWIQVGSDISLSMQEEIYVGMAVTSHNISKKTKATFSNVIVKKYFSPIYPWKKLDVGAVKILGISDYNGILGEYKIAGSGTDIESTSDQFNFTYRELTGNFTLTAQIKSQDNTNDWAKAGLMIRSNLNANASNAMVAITPKMGAIFQSRKINGGGTAGIVLNGLAPSIWLRIKKEGNKITTYYSKDNSQWIQIGTNQDVSLPDKVYVGMAVSSHNSTGLCNAIFKNISIE